LDISSITPRRVPSPILIFENVQSPLVSFFFCSRASLFPKAFVLRLKARWRIQVVAFPPTLDRFHSLATTEALMLPSSFEVSPLSRHLDLPGGGGHFLHGFRFFPPSPLDKDLQRENPLHLSGFSQLTCLSRQGGCRV